ncbi:hypothetical protein [Ralstonia sp. 24A2]|uniref:hypothetical protein n=1 Tax=Ralstonia sp. 24A2 TaxID=3447364 RepID=UPI003F6A3D61
MATPSLDFCRGVGKEANSLRSDKAPSFFLPATKIQGAIKGSTSKEKGQPIAGLAFVVLADIQIVWLLTFLPYAAP